MHIKIEYLQLSRLTHALLRITDGHDPNTKHTAYHNLKQVYDETRFDPVTSEY